MSGRLAVKIRRFSNFRAFHQNSPRFCKQKQFWPFFFKLEVLSKTEAKKASVLLLLCSQNPPGISFFFLDLRITRWKEDCKVSLMLSSFSTTTLPRPICQEKIHESRDQHGIFFPFILECQKLSMYIGQQLSSYMVWSYPLLWLEGTFMRLYSVLLYFFPNCRLWKRDKDTVQFIKIVLF